MGSSTIHQNNKSFQQTYKNMFIPPKMTAQQQLCARINDQALVSADNQKQGTMKFNHKIGTSKNQKLPHNGIYDRMIELMEQKEALLIY